MSVQYPNIERLKREAKKIVKKTGRPHSAVLDQLARERGWATWSLLVRDVRSARFAAAAAIYQKD